MIYNDSCISDSETCTSCWKLTNKLVIATRHLPQNNLSPDIK